MSNRTPETSSRTPETSSRTPETSNRNRGVPATELADEDLRRELAHLHETRHGTLLDGSESALEAHTERMLALEAEFLRRFPADSAPDPARTRAGSREAAGQEVPGRNLEGSPY